MANPPCHEEEVHLMAEARIDIPPAARSRRQVPANCYSLWCILPFKRFIFRDLSELDRMLDGLDSDYNEEANLVEEPNEVVDPSNEETKGAEDAAAASNDRWCSKIFSLGRHCSLCDTAFGACLGTRVENAAAASNHRWWSKFFPLGRHCSLSDTAFGACLETVASTMVMAVLTLNIYSATYFLAWAKENSGCVVKASADPHALSASDLPDSVKVSLKIAAVGLPFTFVPLTLCVSGIAKAAEKGGRGLGVAAGLVIGEVVYVILLGGVMTVCMSDKSYMVVGAVTVGLLVSLIWLWGCTFKYPKCLRRCAHPSWCCPPYEDPEVGDIPGAGV